MSLHNDMHLANTLCAYNSIQGGNLLNNDKNVNLEKPAYCRSFPRNKEKKKKRKKSHTEFSYCGILKTN